MLTLLQDGSPAGPTLKYVSSHAEVSAFCCAVVSKIMPCEFWSRSGRHTSNKTTLLRYVKDFVGMRKFESFTLHKLSQGLKVCSFLFQALHLANIWRRWRTWDGLCH